MTEFSAQVAAEVRRRLGARRVTQRQLAEGIGMSSHNYLSTRLRDERPLTLDDVAKIAEFFGTTPAALIVVSLRVEQ